MPYVIPELEDRLVWAFRVGASGPEYLEVPGTGLDVPQAWMDAVVAVAGDMGCLRFGREVVLDRLVWEFSIGAAYTVAIGWRPGSDLGGFTKGEGVPMGADFGDAAVWVADTVQGELAGYEFVQWPSHGRHLLRPRRVDGIPVWVDPITDQMVCAIRELCASN
ncbi:hypothetical protein [Nocardia lasii]|uniref:SMI1/KNR4 family protein n=1 Tax=Nocardia lasii TaxID=1616107 RepID=A0ABW1JR47_9NOCA